MFRKRIIRKQLLEELDYLLLMIESDWDCIELLEDDVSNAEAEITHLRAENKKLIRLLFEVR